MILIANIGSRDVEYKETFLENKNLRKKSKQLLENFNEEQTNITYPILSPYFQQIGTDFKHIYLFVTNQEDQRYRATDTLYIGAIVKKWIEGSFHIETNVVNYPFNPTSYELVYKFYTEYFSQKRSIFDKSEKRIISLSGGTPQMIGALYVILSSLYQENNEFYNVDKGDLIPINQDRTINKIYMKQSSKELLNINQYQSLLELLQKYQVQNSLSLKLLVEYAHLRRNFDFDRASQIMDKFFNSLPRSQLGEFRFLELPDISNTKILIKELYWDIELCYNNQNYLFLIALLFRLEEAILTESLDYFYRDKIDGSIKDIKNHHNLIQYIKDNEEELWNSLQQITIRTQELNISEHELNRPVMFYIVWLKVESLKGKGNYPWQIDQMIKIIDRINKYLWDPIKEDPKKKLEDYYNTKIGTENLGDLRNQSLLAHGFKPVSKEKIEYLYGEDIEEILEDLRNSLRNFLVLAMDTYDIDFKNIYQKINQMIKRFIDQL